MKLNTIYGTLECKVEHDLCGNVRQVPAGASTLEAWRADRSLLPPWLAPSDYIRTTPQQVRSALKKSGMPYGVAKAHGVWYVYGEETNNWYSSSLNVRHFGCIHQDEWVKTIAEMEVAGKFTSSYDISSFKCK